MKQLYPFTLIICLFACTVLKAQRFHITKDIYSASNSNPAEMAILNGITYFKADDGLHGFELWRTDGTPAGTYIVKDIYEGISNSHLYDLTVSNNILFFKAYTPAYGMELWKTDGTKNGTVMVKDIWQGAENGMYGSDYPNYLTDVNGTLYFSANSPVAGNELWKSDGTEAGTVMVKDLNRQYGSEPNELTAYDGLVYFFAHADQGDAFFKSNGTDSGTVMVTDIERTSLSDWVTFPGIFVFNNIMYFANYDKPRVTGLELWRSDGTASGTYLLRDIYPGLGSSRPSELAEAGGQLFFEAGDPAHGEELWKTDGTPQGTVLVKDIATDPFVEATDILGIASLNGKVYFHYHIFNSDESQQDQLWGSDGSEEGTQQVFDFSGGAGLVATPTQLFFTKNTPEFGNELWKSNGTPAGTVIVKDILAGSYSGADDFPKPVVIGNTVFFEAQNDTTGFELWKSDGSNAGTALVKDINQSSTPGSYLKMITPYNGKLFFMAFSHIYGYEPFISDGTNTGTFMLKETEPGTPYTPTYNAFEFKDLLYFQKRGFDDFTRDSLFQELWKTDGTAEGTELQQESANLHKTGNITPGGNIIYYTYYSKQTGSELWKTNGKKKNAELVKDINPGSRDAMLSNLTYFRGVLYFSATDGVHGEELWRSDGTEAGTYMLKEMQPGIYSSRPKGFFAYKKWLYFSTEFGREMWRTDGTEAGTEKIYDSSTGEVFINGGNLVISKDMLLFSANNSIVGKELWKTDGKSNTAALVKDLFPATKNFLISSLTNVNGQLCFLADSSIYDYPPDNKIWISDGTAAGTKKVEDANLADVRIFSPMVNVNNRLFFIGTNHRYGEELWSGTLQPAFIAKKTGESLVSLPEGIKLSAAPNPFTNTFFISLQQTKPGKIYATITGVHGLPLVKQSYMLTSGSNNIRYNTASWAAGVYFVQVKGSGGLLQTIKVVKQ